MRHLTKLAVCVFSILILASLGLSAQGTEPKSYLVMCKGGPGMKIQHSSTQGRTYLYLKISFQRGTKAATAGLASGTCAWADRGISSHEPHEMLLEPSQDTTVFVLYTPTLKGFEASISVEGAGQAPKTTAGLQHIIDAVQSGREFQVHGYSKNRNNSNVLQVTKYGP